MASCMVLKDKDVHEILISLDKAGIDRIRDAMVAALKEYSTGDERKYQPNPSIINRPNGPKTLFRPFTSPTSVGMKIVVTPFDPKAPLHGILALCDENGLPTGFVNAEEVTGYRTSLNALILYTYRRETANIVVFGAGKQALWHLRLALAMRGPAIKHISIINRSVERTKSLIERLEQENEVRWKSKASFHAIEISSTNYEQDLQSLLADADVVFCTVPSKSPLFPAEYLVKPGVQRKGCYVSAIGSWQSDMIEVDAGVLQEAAARSIDFSFPDQQQWGVITDDRKESLKNSGEMVQSKLDAGQIAELGELLTVLDNAKQHETNELRRWLEEGFIFYKSIGVSITDLVLGNILLSMAGEQKRGLQVQDF